MLICLLKIDVRIFYNYNDMSKFLKKSNVKSHTKIILPLSDIKSLYKENKLEKVNNAKGTSACWAGFYIL